MKRIVRTGFGLGLIGVASAALAMPSMLGAFNSLYKNDIPKDSALSKAGCTICHIGHGPRLNPYGDDIKKAMAGAKVLTPAIIKKVESLDSDKDGVKNIDEIKKGTLPGDAKSK